MEALNADPQIARSRINWTEIRERFEKSGWSGYSGKIYGVPRGGAIVAGLLFPAGNIVDCAKDADLIVDDIVDSGLTKTILSESYPDKMFWALVDKKKENLMINYLHLIKFFMSFKRNMELKLRDSGWNLNLVLTYIFMMPPRQLICLIVMHMI